MFINGHAGQLRFDDIHELVFSPDGQRLAYVGERGEGESKTARVVLDGKEGPVVGAPSDLTFSPSSVHLAYLAFAQGQTYSKHLLLDHKLVKPWAGENLFFSADWQHLAYRQYDTPGPDFYLDERRFGPHDGYNSTMALSPAGDRLAYVMESKSDSSSQQVYVNGSAIAPKSSMYITELDFSPQGRLYWRQREDKKVNVYRDGALQASWDSVLSAEPAVSFSPQGSHCLYAACRGNEYLVVIDGKPEASDAISLREHSGFVFDNEREYHYFDVRKDGLYLVCANVGDTLAPDESVCVRKARQIYSHPE